jgi:alkyl sulfatase BDS1-like metallo-beta-lactamase superfamily hydrolase
MHHIPEEIIERVEKLKKKGKFNDALKIINHILMKEPTNKQALLQVADIEYRQ